jgi:hypothetical protein
MKEEEKLQAEMLKSENVMQFAEEHNIPRRKARLLWKTAVLKESTTRVFDLDLSITNIISFK